MMLNSRQTLFSAIALGLLLAVSACNRPPPAADVGQDAEPTLDSAVSAPRVYEPMSKTAEAITGPLEFTEIWNANPGVPRMKVIAGLGHTWEISFAQTIPASAMIGPRPWLSFMPIAADAIVSVFAVDNETIQAKTVNGGPCGPEGTRFMAFNEGPAAGGGTQMTMAAFKDKIWPPIHGAAPQLCGTFTYTLSKANAPPPGTP